MRVERREKKNERRRGTTGKSKEKEKEEKKNKDKNWEKKIGMKKKQFNDKGLKRKDKLQN